MSLRKLVFGSIRSLNLSLFRKPLPRRVAVYFHELDPGSYGAFAGMTKFFRDQDYQIASPDEFLRQDGLKKLFLSFDDNYISWYRGLEFLDALRIRATFYVNTLPMRDVADATIINNYYDRLKCFGDRTPINSSELRSISQAGHTVGSHGHSHLPLSEVPEAKAQEDIGLGKRILEDILGEPVYHFSYPFGMRRHFNEMLRDYCQRIGFRSIASARPGLQHCKQKPMSLNRSLWNLQKDLQHNISNIQVDGRIFEFFTGRSPVG